MNGKALRRPMRRLAVAAGLLLVATLVSGCTEATEHKGPVGDDISLPLVAALPTIPDALTFAASGCEQVALLAPVPADKAADLLPPGYQVYRDESGLAWFGVSFTGCDAFSVAGAAQKQAMDLAEAGIIVTSPDGTGGVHAYRLVGTTDADAVGRHLAAFGAPGGHLPETQYDAESLLAVATHVGDAPWPGLGVGIEAGSGASLAPVEALEMITWWSETPSGTLRIGYTFTDITAAPAQGTVLVESGSPFEGVLDGTDADAGGFLFTHGFDAVAEIVPLA